MTELDLDLLSSWTFTLPDEHIAKAPLAVRSASRLLHLDRDGVVHHRQFVDVVDLLDAGDLLVMNDTSVIPARLHGHKRDSGGRVELLLVRAINARRWVVLLGASKTPKPGNVLTFGDGDGDGDGTLEATVVGPMDNEPGAFVVDTNVDALAFAQRHGALPLPPYLGRAPELADTARYQTVFRDVDKAGSVAAPTAGLHFDDDVLARLARKGVQTASVTLHVGPGTFVPVRTARLSEHVMHPEAWWLSDDTAHKIAMARAANKRVVAVGTTAARVLESSGGRAGSGLTRLFIKPGTTVTTFDALITNFHLPESTLLVLVGTFAGRERVLRAYDEAIARSYRFYSYGDACFVERPT